MSRKIKKKFLSGEPPKNPKDKLPDQLRLCWKAFIKTIEHTGSRGAAYRASGFNPHGIRELIRDNEWMQDEIEEAEAKFVADLESHALKLALGKLNRPILFKGNHVRLKNPDTGKWENAYEDVQFPTVLLAMLKAHSDRYRTDMNLSGSIEVKEVKGVSPSDL